MSENRKKIIERVFDAQNNNGLWKVIPENHKYFPNCLHYVPTYKASLWTFLLLAELKCDKNDPRIKQPLKIVKNHLFDEEFGVYSLKEDHFPIPCFNGNMLYLDCYFNGKPDNRSIRLLDFFYKFQRFDDGEYIEPKNEYCSNKSCYGKHTCYWGIVKLIKGISFISHNYRTENIIKLRDRCIDFVLKHKVCYSSHKEGKVMINKIDWLTFPNFYKSDFLEILWILKRENIASNRLNDSLELLKSKRNQDGKFNLERKMSNMVTSIGSIDKPNEFVTERAEDVISYYDKM